ncbi:MAG: thiamine-phosphate kinase [Gemmatimonadaceae bacterium]|nr:thiamine-phosphate kinase [Gemmatimonadaceae bacterium]
MTANTPLGPGGEFDIIRALVARWGATAAGIGDDAAILDVPPGERLVVSVDSSVEEVHFRRAWLTPWEIGWRATAAALSDLGAAGATPMGVLVSLSLSPAWLPHVAALGDGIAAAVRGAGTVIVGGDTTRGDGLCIALTVLGRAAAPLRRSGARPGDTIYVTGRLGGPLLALRALEAGRDPSPHPRERFAHPIPRIREGEWLARHGVHAAIDISDGLVGDAAHIAAASGVRLSIDLDALPTVSGISPMDAAVSGEEYELLVTAPALDAARFERELGVPLTAIGRVESGAPGVHALLRGERVALGGGFSHFS